MKITYICHSGFLVETAVCYYLFDYYKGTLPRLDPSRPVFVFASHGHADHYNPGVFPLLEESGMTTIIAVLSNDIPRKRYPIGYLPLTPDTSEAAPQTFSLSPGHFLVKVYHSQEYDLPCSTHIQTLLSTDKGVAFLVACPEGILYHAGDLNDWNTADTPEKERRQMRGNFRASLSRLKKTSIDTAFLPLDPRLGDSYADGFLYFLQTISVKTVYPMHFWDQPDIISRFLEEHPEYAGLVQNHPFPG